MKKALLFLLCTIFLLTACNADTPKDTQSSDTVPPSIESTAESQPTESTDDTYFLFSMTQTDSTVFSPTFESFIKENYGELMQKVPDLLSRCINVTPSELSDTIELYRFGYDSLSVDGHTFLVYDNQVYALGISFGGFGVTEFAYFHSGDTHMLYYIYSWGSGIHRSHVGTFDFNTKQFNGYEGDTVFWQQDISFCLSEDGKTLGLCEADINWDDIKLGTVTISKGNVLYENIQTLMDAKEESLPLETDEFGRVAPEDLCFDDFRSFQENVTTFDEVTEKVGQCHGSLSVELQCFWETTDGGVTMKFKNSIATDIYYHPHDTQTT